MSWTKFPNKMASPHSPTTTAIGKQTECLAEQYLTQQGLVSITKNFHCRQGEIDLIMQEKNSKEQNTWVFIEVKYRKNNHFGGAIHAISASKQRKIKHCVAFFLQKSGLNEYNTPCRFDVIAIDGDINRPEITWLKNAF